jgi:hypothetical protein
MSNMGKTDNFIDFITISGTIIFERKGSGHSGNSLNKIFAGMTKRGVLEIPLQKPPNRSVVFLRQHDLDQVPRDFLRWFLYRKPPPLTKTVSG